MLKSNTINEVLIDAIQNKTLRETLEQLTVTSSTLSTKNRNILDNAATAIRELDNDVECEIARLVSELEKLGVTVIDSGKAAPKAVIHNIKLEVSSSQLDSAVTYLESEGYRCDLRTQLKFWSRYKKFYGSAAFHGVASSPFRVQLVWKTAYNIPTRLEHLLKPHQQDLRAINLPSSLWPAYYLVHVIRAATNRSMSTKNHEGLGPFLGTPDAIIKPLLEFAGLNSGDTLIDLGCGDGRILVAATSLFKCKAIGYETDPNLAKQASKLVAQKGLSPHITIKQENAENADLADASVVFIFLPVQSVKRLVPMLLQKMKRGSVLIAHEQDRLDMPIDADEQYPVIHRSGVSVAHKWIAGSKP